MEILEQLTPAETYLIRDHSDSTFKELLKLTFADLCLKKVLRIESREGQSDSDDPAETLKYIVTGRNFQSYNPKAHELALLGPFQKDPEIELLFDQLVKITYENAGSRKRYVFNALLASPEISTKFQRGFFTRLLGDIVLNDEGRSMKVKIDRILQQLETELPEIIQTDKKKALEILGKINGNVFLINGLEFDLLKEIDEELVKELERDRDDYMYYGCGGCFTSYGHHSGAFDEAFESADSSGGWGDDSGDDGCSGCGGCD